MNRYLIVFIIVTALGIGAIIVYAKNTNSMDKPDSIQQQLTNFASQSAQQGSGPQPSAAPTPDVTKLQVHDITVGTSSAEVKAGDSIEVNYVGAFLDGKKFDSSYDRGQTFTFTVGKGEVIKGWDEGLIGMKIGGKRELLIPADKAYGAAGNQGIPPNSPLYFQVELVNISPMDSSVIGF